MSQADVFSIVLLAKNDILREGLRRILLDGGFCLEQSVASVLDLDAQARNLKPTLVVFDWVKGDDLDENLFGIRSVYASANIVVLADEFSCDSMVQVFNAGAHGYIVKRLGCDSLVASLRLVAMGEKVMPSQLANQLSEVLLNHSLSATKTADLTELLSERELETMRYLLGGNPNKVIANHLDVSEATVKVHVKSILRKLGVRNRTQAAIWAVNNGLEMGVPAFTPSGHPAESRVASIGAAAAR